MSNSVSEQKTIRWNDWVDPKAEQWIPFLSEKVDDIVKNSYSVTDFITNMNKIIYSYIPEQDRLTDSLEYTDFGLQFIYIFSITNKINFYLYQIESMVSFRDTLLYNFIQQHDSKRFTHTSRMINNINIKNLNGPLVIITSLPIESICLIQDAQIEPDL